jgi:hypothetical protein
MNTSTGEIFKLYDGMMKGEDEKEVAISEAELKMANFMKKIPEKYLPELQGMNRQARRAFYKDHKKDFKEADEPKEGE